MFPEVVWPAKRPQPSLFVPPSTVAVTPERTFVVRIRNRAAEWVDVKRGVSMGDLVEVFGDLAENDIVATRGTDELRQGMRVNVKESAPESLSTVVIRLKRESVSSSGFLASPRSSD